MCGSSKMIQTNMTAKTILRTGLAAILLAPVSCGKLPQAEEAGLPEKASFYVSATIPDVLSRVTFDDGGQLQWEGGESVGLLFGNANSIEGAGRLTARLDEADKKGVFAGEVDIGDFTANDLRGVVYPYSDNHYYRRNGNSYRIVMTVGGTADEDKVMHQVQHHDNVLNGDNITLFSVLYPEDILVEDGRYVVDGKQFRWGCSLVRFNIYGAGSRLAADEVFKSIELSAVSSSSILGRQEWQIEKSAFIWNGVSNHVFVELEEPCTLADRTAENGVKVFMTLMSRNYTFQTGSYVVVHTDKGSYKIPVETGFDLSQAGLVRRVGIDLGASFPYVSPTDPDAVQYSADGGATWSPDIPGTFSTLAVKGAVTAAILSGIKSAMDGPAGGVALDLSASTYSSTTFPNTFAGSSSSPYMKLKSIKFPSNVVTLAASAFSYCKGLESADLTGIQNLSPEANNYLYAFADTGLKSITFPETFTGAMERSFVNTYDLESIYWNTPWNPGNSQNWRTFQWGRGNNSATDNTPKSKDLVLYVGTGAVAVPRNCFRNNHNLTKVVVEAGAGFTFLDNCFVNCDNLAAFELRGTEPPAINSINIYDANTTSSKVPQASRKVIIPHGATEDYTTHTNWANWSTLISSLHFTLEEASE